MKWPSDFLEWLTQKVHCHSLARYAWKTRHSLIQNEAGLTWITSIIIQSFSLFFFADLGFTRQNLSFSTGTAMFLTALLFIFAKFFTVIPVHVLSQAAFNSSLPTCQLNYTCCGNVCVPYESNCERKKLCCTGDAYLPWNLHEVIQSSKCHNISCKVAEIQNSTNSRGSILLCNSKIYGKTRVSCLCMEESPILVQELNTTLSPFSKLTTTTRSSDNVNITTDFMEDFNKKKFGALLLGPLLFFPFMCILIVIARGLYFSRRSRNRRSSNNLTRESLSQQARSRNDLAIAPENEQHTRAPTSSFGFLSELSHNPNQPPSYDYVISQGNSLSGTQHQMVSSFPLRNAINTLDFFPPAYNEIIGQNVNEGYLPSYEEATTDHSFDS